MRIIKLIFAICVLVYVDSATSLLSYHNGAYDIGSLSSRYGHKASSDHLAKKYIATHNSYHSPKATDDVVDSHFKVKKTLAKSYLSVPLSGKKPLIEDLEESLVDSPRKYRKDEPVKNNYISLNENYKENSNVNTKKDFLKKAIAPSKQVIAPSTRSSKLNYSYARLEAAGSRLKTIVDASDETANSFNINANRNRKRTVLSPQQSSQSVFYSKTKTINQKDRQYAKVPLGDDSIDKLKERPAYSRHVHKSINDVNPQPSAAAIKKTPMQGYMEEKVISGSTRMNKNTALTHTRRESDVRDAPKWRKLEPIMPQAEKSFKDSVELNVKSDGYEQAKKTFVQPSRYGQVGEKNNQQRYALFYRANPATINPAEEDGFIPIRGETSGDNQSKSDSSFTGTVLDSKTNYLKQYRGSIMTGKYRKFS